MQPQQQSSMQRAIQNSMHHAQTLSRHCKCHYYRPMSTVLHTIYPLQENFLVYLQYRLHSDVSHVRLVLALDAVGLQLILPHSQINPYQTL
jgi:hypothetical protein